MELCCRRVLTWSLTSLAVSQIPVSSGACHPERLTLGLNASSGGRASLLRVHTCTYSYTESRLCVRCLSEYAIFEDVHGRITPEARVLRGLPPRVLEGRQLVV